jgi:multidrug efflux pump subunit AcrA (membrane-fusion protein)
MKAILVRSAMPLLILAAGLGAMLAMGSRQQETQEPASQRQSARLEALTVRPFVGDLTLEIDGVVAPVREIEVASEVAGRVHFKADVCRAGYFVRRGTPLVEIDTRDYELERLRSQKQRERAEAELAEVDVDLANIEALISLAERDLKLQQNELDRLLRISQSISESETDRARRAVVVAENALQTLKNQESSNRVRRDRLRIAAELAEADLQIADLDLQRTKIAAPVDGVIVQDSVEQGGFVQRGTPLFRIEDTSSVEVLCNLKMSDLYWLWRQPPAAAASADASDEAAAYRVPQTAATVIYQFAGRDDLRFSWQGTLTRFEGSGLDERTRTAPCRVVVSQPRDVTFAGSPDRQAVAGGPPALVRGMFVTVLLHLRLDGPLVQIPDEALQPGKFVWRVRDGRLKRLGPLALVQRLEQHDPDGRPRRFWVTPAGEADLSPADQLVITPIEGLADGAAVEVQVIEAASARTSQRVPEASSSSPAAELPGAQEAQP